MKQPKRQNGSKINHYYVLSFYAERGDDKNYNYTFKNCGTEERARKFLRNFKGVRAAYYQEWYKLSKKSEKRIL